MTSQTLDALNQTITSTPYVRFEEGRGGLPRLVVESPLVSAAIYLQGAHLTHFAPMNHEPVLFTSSQSAFAAGKAIRGGMPVIFPWFGPRASDGIMHGFVRTRVWTVESVDVSADGTVEAVFSLQSTNETRALWPSDFVARMRFTLGERLRVELEIANTSTQPFSFECALHSYFQVSDVRSVTILGLKGVEYLDKNRDLSRFRENADLIRLNAPVDRVYFHSGHTCVIEDPGLRRRIVIEKSGSQSTVVWNPWSDNMAKFSDLAPDDWLRFVCVETANAKADAVTLLPGAIHAMTAGVHVEMQ